MDSTNWLGWHDWFLGCLDRAFDGTEEVLGHVLHKARFWEAIARETFSERQRSVINRLLGGFEGKLTSSKWAKLTKVSSDTAIRDITDLVDRGVPEKEDAGDRSSIYRLVEPTRG